MIDTLLTHDQSVRAGEIHGPLDRLVRNASSMPNIRNASMMDMNVNTRRNLRRFRFAQMKRQPAYI